MDESDQDLIDSYLAGEEVAFAHLVERHLKAVYGFALRYTHDTNEAEDIVQESFLKAWKNLKQYEAKKARYKTWLMYIVRNTAIDHTRRRKNVSFSELDSAGSDFSESVADETPLPDEIMARKDDKTALDHGLDQISLPHREILILYNGNDFTFGEIASILDTSVNTVKSRYRRAVQALREALMHPKEAGPRI